MNQILVAAARGARIQALYGGVWSGVSGVHLAANTPHIYSIHPEDEHLRCGPISTALRENAVHASVLESLTFPDEFGSYWINGHDYRSYQDCENKLQRSLFLLILAEALADQGL